LLEHLNSFPRDTKALAFLGQVYEESQNYQEAIRAYKRILSVDETNVQVMLKIIQALLKTDKMDILHLSQISYWLERAEKLVRIPEHKMQLLELRIEFLKRKGPTKTYVFI
jgi:tetratricopeptide (TPR) repeat protein